MQKIFQQLTDLPEFMPFAKLKIKALKFMKR
jgi:hypothetical protein